MGSGQMVMGHGVRAGGSGGLDGGMGSGQVMVGADGLAACR